MSPTLLLASPCDYEPRHRGALWGEACVQRAGARLPHDGDEVADGERLVKDRHADNLVPPPDAERLHAAARDPKTVQWYDAGHGLSIGAVRDRMFWLQEHLGMRAPNF